VPEPESCIKLEIYKTMDTEAVRVFGKVEVGVELNRIFMFLVHSF
jgi:hypothetical protein